LIQNETTSELPVTVKFTVTNSASTDPNYAEVLFDEVQLLYGIPPNWHLEKYNNLEAGQSFTVDYKCGYRDILEIQYQIEGKVSFEAFFKTKKRNGTLEIVRPTLSTLDFIRAFNETKIHHWLEDTIKSIPVPNDSLSLAELKVKVEQINAAIKEIENTGKYIDNFPRFAHIESPGVQEYSAFKESLQRYTLETIKGLSQLRTALETPNSYEFQHFASVRENIVLNLSGLGSRLNTSMEKFMLVNNVSDADAHYAYRTWHT
jgi:hypothetical protein